MRHLLVVLVAGILCSAASAQNLVTNPGFETGDFSGWTFVGGHGGVTDSWGSVSPPYCAYLDNLTTLGLLEQTLPTTPGAQYEVSFWMRSAYSKPNILQAYWNGTLLQEWVDDLQGPFVQYTYLVTAAGSDTLKFYNRYDAGYWFLDDVSVVKKADPVPEMSTIAPLALFCLGGLGLIARRRRRS